MFLQNVKCLRYMRVENRHNLVTRNLILFPNLS